MPDAVLKLIEQAIDDFEAALPIVPPDNLSLLIARRLELAKSVNGFLADERQTLNDPLDNIVEVLGVEERQKLLPAFAAVRMRYSSHIAKWNNGLIVLRWAEYRADSISLMTEVRDLLRRRTQAMRQVAA